jgi:predicted dehydrogenase
MDSTTDFRLDPQKGGSVFWEEAILWCHLTQLLVGLQPAAVAGQLLARGPGGADAQFEARMAFPNGVVSECYCSYTDPMEANHWIEFDDAVVKIVNFWRPTFGTLKLNCEIQHKHTQQTTPLRFEPRNYFLEQLKCFVAVIRGERENIDPEESFDRIRVMDAIYRAALREPVESATASAPSHAG